MDEKLTPEEHLERSKMVTEKILALEDNLEFPNKWTLKELLLHLWSWDDQMIRGCEAKLEEKWCDFKFDHQEKGLNYDEWNNWILEEKRKLSLKEVKELFQKTRKKSLKLFEKIIAMPETIDDEKNFFRKENVATLWRHDNHHLRQAGIKINF